MCGITGFLTLGGFNVSAGEGCIDVMTAQLDHRGPDDRGHWVDAREGIAFGHTRLSILDLSPAGHQPMESPSSRYVMVFNGEIYNHLELRERLERLVGFSLPWRGHSDTETLLAGFEKWGIKDMLCQCVGMFALAVWDRQKHELTLARDRYGEKPLYYGWQGRSLIFASELKSCVVFPGFKYEIDRDALALMMRFGHVPAPYAIYRGMAKLSSGHMLTIPQNQGNESVGFSQSQPYWSVNEAMAAGLSNPFIGNDAQAIDELESLLTRAIRQQQLADVPVGAFLSGGVDSSTVVALMQAQSMRPVKTFAIGFAEEEFDEAIHARNVALHLGTDHTELYVKPKSALQIIPKLPEIFDEPFADPSQIPTFLVAQLARQQVTVSLSGDGGDELFGGYNRYQWVQKVEHKLQKLPISTRHWLARTMVGIPVARWDGLNDWLKPVLPSSLKMAHLGDKLHKMANSLEASSPQDLYCGVMSIWKNPSQLVLQSEEPSTLFDKQVSSCREFVDWMMAIDSQTYLQDDMLVKVDRAAMAVGLETRVPMLDHRVAEFAWRLPLSMKIREGKGKWILRQILYRHVPVSLIDRPKQGFSVPIGAWLRGPLRAWAEALLDERRLRVEGYFNVELVRTAWQEHLSGRRHWPLQLWNVLMFQAWLEHMQTKEMSRTHSLQPVSVA